MASAIRPEDEMLQVKADRILHEAIKQILEHPVFQAWLKDPTQPKLFRQAGHFWGIAPGTPARTVRDRVQSIDQKLNAALETLRSKGVDQIVEQRGRLLFDKRDIERCMQFHATLKDRFARELQMLAPGSTKRQLVMTSPSRQVAGQQRKTGTR